MRLPGVSDMILWKNMPHTIRTAVTDEIDGQMSVVAVDAR